MYKRALVSVSDKTGLLDFLKPLVSQGMEVVSTGGTGEFLKSHGIPVQDVETLTDFPEVLSGRVKTLHPHVHMSLLARDWVSEDEKVLKQYGLKPFDLVLGNLYPFEEKSPGLKDQELVEWIDVGGPSFLRAAAKNYFRITTLCDPEDYAEAKKGTDLKKRKELAAKVFQRLSVYDSRIAEALSALKTEKGEVGKEEFLKGRFFKKLRYGENPHQEASWFVSSKSGLHSAEIIQGKELSYNNLLDFRTAILTVRDFSEPCAVAVKHNNPCGVAIETAIFPAVKKVLKADPLSVFGGLLACNRPLDEDSAKVLTDLFLEGIVAPDFSASALELFQKKKNLRILKWPDMLSVPLPRESRTELMGGFLAQSRDQVSASWIKGWKCLGAEPSKEEREDLLFAWKVSSHLKSNAIAVVKKGQSLGLGMGQVSRIASVRLALDRVREFHSDEKESLILASDGFFPFPDSIELAAERGVSWIIQPGGSIQDEKVLKRARDLGLSMVLTGQRHFKH